MSPEESFAVAKAIKEQLCYTCPDILAEFQKYDSAPKENFKKHTLKNGSSVDVGYERFLAPEVFFNPEMIGNDTTKPLPELVDEVIQSCPIDGRRGLYNVLDVISFFTIRILSCLVDRRCSRIFRNVFKGTFEASWRLAWNTRMCYKLLTRVAPFKLMYNPMQPKSMPYGLEEVFSLPWYLNCVIFLFLSLNSHHIAQPNNNMMSSAQVCVVSLESLVIC